MRNRGLILGVCLSFLSVCPSLPLFGQSYLIRTYSENDGLASSTIHDLAQTPDGRMWFATRAGVTVYDGTRWTTYSPPLGFPAVSISELAVDATGSLWAWGENPTGTLARFQNGKWEPLFPKAGPAEAIIPAGLVVVGPPGGETAALGTRDGGVFLYRAGAWKRVGIKEGLASDKVHGLAAIGTAIYAATDGGLSVIRDGAVDDALNATYPILRRGVVGIVAEDTPAGRLLWLAGRTWLARLAGGNLQVMAESLAPHTDSTHPHLAMSPDGTGGAYFGNPFSVFHWQAATREVELLGRGSGLIAEGATAILLDREMNVWIASLRGLSKISGYRFANFRESHGLLEDEVTAIVQLKDGRLVFGHNLGLTFFDGRSFRPVPFVRRSQGQPTQSRVLDMIVDEAGIIWAAAASRGLARVSPDGSIRWYGAEAGLGTEISSVARAGPGRLWITSNSGLLLFSDGHAVQVNSPVLINRFLRKIGRTLDGKLIVTSSSAGIFVREASGWVQYKSPDNDNANNAYSVVDDGRGHLLVGTLAGLFEAKDGRLRPFALPGLRLERPVYLILREPDGTIWFGTDNGVVRWDGEVARAYTGKQGFAGPEVNRSAGLVDASGRVWIGTSAGVSRYQAEFDFAPGRIPPPIVKIERIAAGGSWYGADTPLRLTARQNSLEFEFRAVTFVDETAVRYRYRLDGFDSIWSDPRPAVERMIRYTNLPPGHFTLQLRAENALGGWSAPVASPEIAIASPLTRRWWFFLLAGGGLLFLVFIAFQLITEKRTARSLERLVGDRTAQIRTALEEKSVLLREVHHRVKNNLQIVASLLSLQSRKVKSPESLSLFQESMDRVRAMALIHENLYRSESAAAIGAVDYIRRLANDLMAAYALRAGNVSLKLDVADVPLTPDTAFPCGLIINELVSNSLKHAFPEGRSGTICIDLQRDGEALALTVADDGKGLPEGIDAASGGSLGLRLVRNLASQLGGALEVASGPGTRFTVRFPAV